MRKLLILSTLIFSTMMFSSTSFAEWKKVRMGDRGVRALTSVLGITNYVDFDAIKKKDGYVYYWSLWDYAEKRENGNMSHKNYYQIDCKTLKYKHLIHSSHKEPMGRGTGKIKEVSREWSEKDRFRNIREKVCEHANLHEKN